MAAMTGARSATVSQEIKAYREAHGQTREALANQLGVSIATVAKWERSERRPTGKRREAIEAMLGTTTAATPATDATKRLTRRTNTPSTAPAKRATKRASTDITNSAPAKRATTRRTTAKRTTAKRTTATRASAPNATAGRRRGADVSRNTGRIADGPVVLFVTGAGTPTLEVSGDVRVVTLDLTELHTTPQGERGEVVVSLSAEAATLPAQLMSSALHHIADAANQR